MCSLWLNSCINITEQFIEYLLYPFNCVSYWWHTFMPLLSTRAPYFSPFRELYWLVNRPISSRAKIFLVLIHGQYLLNRPFFNPIVFKRKDYVRMHKDSYWDFDINWGQQWWVTWQFSFFFSFLQHEESLLGNLKRSLHWKLNKLSTKFSREVGQSK